MFEDSVIGLEIGSYHKGAKDDLINLVEYAEEIYDEDDTSDENINNAIYIIQQTINKFYSLKIPESTGGINADGVINIGDLSIVSKYQGNVDNNIQLSVNSDLNKDGKITEYEIEFITSRILGN